jgi:hypothetical protein
MESTILCGYFIAYGQIFQANGGTQVALVVVFDVCTLRSVSQAK